MTSRSTLLFCWEAGANYGHLSSIAAMREALEAAGCDLIYAVADLKAARAILGADAKIFQAPVWPSYRHSGGRVEAAGYSDTLTLMGFGAPQNLGAVVDGWLSLISVIAPHLIIADHSPAAQVAAAVAGQPLVTMGTGFTQPPLDGSTLPPLRVDIPSAQTEEALLASARQVLQDRRAPTLPETLVDLLRPDGRIVIGLPELDPYRSFRNEPLVAPTGGFPRYGHRPTKRLFVYLGAEMPYLEEKVQVLCDLPIEVEIFVRDGGEMLRRFIEIRGKIGHSTPANINESLSRATHVISQGGAMLASEATAAGCAQMILPLHREPEINANLLARAGVGRVANPKADAVVFAGQVNSFLADEQLSKASVDLARLLERRPMRTADVALLADVARLL